MDIWIGDCGYYIIGDILLSGGNMITRTDTETLEQYKTRLINETRLGNLTAEEAFECYEEAVQKEMMK